MSRSRRSSARAERHHSAGGLVIGEHGVLLISTREGSRWQLPKGHLEAGEGPEQAAVREVREETGVTGRIVSPLPGIDYFFVEQRERRIHKHVDFFLLRYESGDPTGFDPREVSGAGWFSWEEALARLSFPSERRVVEAARAIAEAAPAEAIAEVTEVAPSEEGGS